MRKRKNFFIMIITCFVLLVGCNDEPMDTEPFDQGNLGTLYGPIMETDSAYYYNSRDFEYELHYYDKATGESIFLCNKPECSHDGNEFCVATAGERYVLYSALYNNAIYIATMEQEDERIDLKLLKASLDGTELTEICTYNYDLNVISHLHNEFKYMAIYNNQAFIPYCVYQEDQTDGYAKLGTAIVNLKTGKVEYLEEYDSKVSSGASKFIPEGEYLYYFVANQFYDYPKLYRYHLDDKTTEEIPIEGGFRDYCIYDGMIYFTQYTDDFTHIGMLDPNTGEMEDLTGPLADENGNSLINEWGGHILSDGTYMIISADQHYLNKDARFYVFDLSGEYLAEFSCPLTYTDANDTSFINGKVYFQDYYKAVVCPMDNILAGTPQWETLYVLNEEE